jgi:hypothetical protein
MQLTQQAHYVPLRRRIITETLDGFLPELVNAKPSIHKTYHVVNNRGEAIKLPSGLILQNIPELSAIMMAMNPGMLLKAGLQLEDTIP